MKSFRFISVVVAICLWCQMATAAEPYMFRSIKVEDGLSQNMVYCILQDSSGFMWFGTQDGLNRYDGAGFKVFKSGEGTDFGNDGVCCLAEGADDDLWIGTIRGLYVYSQASGVFRQVRNLVEGHPELDDALVRNIVFDSGDNAYVSIADTYLVKMTPAGTKENIDLGLTANSQIRSICADGDDNLWLATYYGGLIRVSSTSGKVERFTSPQNGLHSDLFTKVTFLNNETLLAGTMDVGVVSFDLRTHRFSAFDGMDGKLVRHVHDIMVDRRGRIWVGSENGLHVCDEGRVDHISHIPNNPYSLSDNAIFSIAEDCNGGVWVGSYFGGVNYYSDYSSQFRKFFPIPGYNNLTGKNISEFCESADGQIWLGSEDAGLFLFNPADGSFKSGFLPAGNIHALALIDGKLWVGSYGDGLFILDPKTHAYVRHDFSEKTSSLYSNNIYSICQDATGTTWVGTESGLFSYDSRRKQFDQIKPELFTSQILDIETDFEGGLWVTTVDRGLFHYDANTGAWTNPDLGSKYFTCILEDRNHDLLFGTEEMGILFFSHTEHKFSRLFSKADGLPDDMVYKMLEASDGSIWGTTNHGLFRISPDRGNIVCFDHKSGLICDQFNFNSGLRSRDGIFYFGGVNGFISYDPDNFLWPSSTSKIVFSRLLFYNREVEAGDAALAKSITYTDHVAIAPEVSVFSIGFSDLNFTSTDEKTYQYMLDGYHHDWISMEDAKLITLSNIPPGTYRLDVRSNPVSSLDGPVSSIDITILPHWYETKVAKAAYALIALTMLLLGVMMIRIYVRRKNLLVVEEFERRKEKELYDAKIGFFTHITHEIRTPLTLITVPIENLMKKEEDGSPIYEELSMIQRNSNRLLTLVNELLDFRKAGVGNADMNYVHTDVIERIRGTVSRFGQLAELRNITIHSDVPETLMVDIDTEIFEKMLSNVLNNACKHASSFIDLAVEHDNDNFRVIVSNDGDVIPPKDAERIFDPFVKLDDHTPGSGIGLPFARTLAKSHGGKLSLDLSKPVTTFVLELPIAQENTYTLLEPDPNPPVVTEEWNNDVPMGVSGKTILVVDDNEDLLALLAHSLSPSYVVLTASNGAEAIDILSRESVDLVLSDLMMPGVDGTGLCAHVRENFSTSHIPVIILSARSDIETRLECLKIGVDEYITKPFSTDYLMARIENLLSSRETLKQAFRQSPDIAAETMATSKADSVFLEKLSSIIDEKMDNPDLDVDMLADHMSMSRATLYRKMKSVTDLSPNDFIRICRLKKAAQLLVANEYQINEIAYLVGFGSVSYFSKCFSKQFGVSPKDYMK